MATLKTFQHPTFGPCEAVSSLVAIRWATPQEAGERDVAAALASLGLGAASDKALSQRRETELVNQSPYLTWATSGRALTDAAWKKLAEDPRIAWAAPVYRAKGADEGPRSYFTIDPTVLLLSEAAAARVGELSALDAEVTIDTQRSQLMKGFVVLKLGRANALEVASRLLAGALAGVPNGVVLENIPYLSPTCCGCSGETHHAPGAGGRCRPAADPHLPNDPIFPQQWGVLRVNAPNAWPLTQGDPNVVVAVLDQGVELGHPDLHLWPVSYSTITHTNDGSPVGNHGTPCAGIISARADNALGVAGMASGSRVMAISTFFADTQVAEGLYFAADHGARVVSMSFGVYASWMIWNFALIEAALQYCQDKNVLLVAASGNENQAVSRFPGSDPRTLCVGGSNRDDVRKSVGDSSAEPWWGACFGPSVDVVAPCLEMPSTDRLGGAGYSATDYVPGFNGTSSATPCVAGAAALVMSINPALSAEDVRRILSETTDKINLPAYTYLPTAGKPHGSWNTEVGYGRINAERAVLAACAGQEGCHGDGPCVVALCEPEPCCVSPCEPPWRPQDECLVWYSEKFFRAPLDNNNDTPIPSSAVRGALRPYVEFRITFEHKLCPLGKQQGPLLFTTTLLPGETVRIYHSDRYRRITSTQQRYSVQTTFMQFLSAVHEARESDSFEALNERFASASSSSSSASGGSVLFGLFNFGGASANTSSSATASHSAVAVRAVSEQFSQSVRQASLLTQAERSVVVSTYEEKDVQDITSRVLSNPNECRAVTYFVRQVMELYSLSSRVFGISYRLVAAGVPAEWRSLDELDGLPGSIREQVQKLLKLLPKVGETVENPRPITLPTDGTVYNAELAHCCSCDPHREAGISIRLEREKAEALKLCLEAQQLELEVERRRLLLQRGELAPFEPAAAVAAPAG